jgi:hypothetical protein
MKNKTNSYSVDDFINDVLRIAREKGHKVETLHRTSVPQIDFGHKKLHGDHIRQLFPDALSRNANINSLIDRIARGRPCAHRPFREIIEQIHRERPKAYEEAISSQKTEDN